MVLVQGTIFKRMIDDPEDHWTNVYAIEAANTVAALDNLAEIAAWEADIMGETAEVYRLYAVTPTPGSTGAIRDVTLQGLQPVTTPGELLPQWNTVLVKFFNVAGKPELKYLRLPLYLDMINGQTIKTAVLTTVLTGYASHLEEYEFYVGPTGEPHVGSQVVSVVQMRQTNWHRRSREGFKRGWVAV